MYHFIFYHLINTAEQTEPTSKKRKATDSSKKASVYFYIYSI